MVISIYVKYALRVSVVFRGGEKIAECFGVFWKESGIV